MKKVENHCSTDFVKCFIKSINILKSRVFVTLYFLIIYLTEDIASIVPFPGINLICILSISTCSLTCFSKFLQLSTFVPSISHFCSLQFFQKTVWLFYNAYLLQKLCCFSVGCFLSYYKDTFHCFCKFVFQILTKCIFSLL